MTTENVACGTSGVTCSKMIEITVGEPGTPTFFKLQLVRGQDVVPDAGSPFSVREVGEFVYIDTPFGLSIQWDKGTRVYVRLETQHMNHVSPSVELPQFHFSIQRLKHAREVLF